MKRWVFIAALVIWIAWTEWRQSQPTTAWSDPSKIDGPTPFCA